MKFALAGENFRPANLPTWLSIIIVITFYFLKNFFFIFNNNIHCLLFTVRWIHDQSVFDSVVSISFISRSLFVGSTETVLFLIFLPEHLLFEIIPSSRLWIIGQRTTENSKYLKWNALGINEWIFCVLVSFSPFKIVSNENKVRKNEIFIRIVSHHKTSAINQNRIENFCFIVIVSTGQKEKIIFAFQTKINVT